MFFVGNLDSFLNRVNYLWILGIYQDDKGWDVCTIIAGPTGHLGDRK